MKHDQFEQRKKRDMWCNSKLLIPMRVDNKRNTWIEYVYIQDNVE